MHAQVGGPVELFSYDVGSGVELDSLGFFMEPSCHTTPDTHTHTTHLADPDF